MIVQLQHEKLYDEAEEFQKRFDKAWKEGTIEDFGEILRDIKKVLPSYMLFKK